LEYASKELRNDRQVVLEAIKQRGWVFKYASKELRNNKEVVLEAMKQNRWVLGFASLQLQEELKNQFYQN